MAIVFPKTMGAGERLGGAIGGGLGRGMESGFQALANLKMNQYTQQQQMKMQQQQMQYTQQQQQQRNYQALSSMLPNMSNEQRLSLSNADPALLSKYVTQQLQSQGNEPIARIFASMVNGNQNQQGQPQQVGQQLQDEQLQGQQPQQIGQQLQDEQLQGQQPQQIGQQFQANSGNPQVSADELKNLSSNRLMQTGQTLIKNKQFNENLAFKKSESQEKRSEFQEKGYRQDQLALQPFLKEDREKFQGIKKEKEIASEMLDIANNYKGEFPGLIMGNVPEPLKKMWVNNPKVRRFMQLQAELVRKSAEKGGGRASKHLYQLAESGKTGIGQPIETIQESLQNYINEYGKSKDRERFKVSLRDKKTGRYPTDLPERLVEYDMAEEEPLNYPKYYTENTIYEDENGKRSVLKNGTWKDM